MNELRKRPTRVSQAYAPSPKTIREECEHIQAKWSERERRKRAGRAAEATWTPPRVDVAAVTEAMYDDANNSFPPHWALSGEWNR